MVHTVAVWGGAGTMGRVHMERYMRSGEAQMKYVVDKDHSRAARLAAACGAIATTDPGSAFAIRKWMLSMSAFQLICIEKQWSLPQATESMFFLREAHCTYSR